MSSASSSPSPVSSAALNQDIHGPATSSNLYLVTFLATLFLLLFVSCAIVLRSYIMRRRYQRRLDEAMATGLLLAPRAPGSKRKRFGTKPKLYDAWLAGGGVTWDHIKPLAAQPVFVKRKYKDAPPKHSTIADAQVEQDLEDILANGIRPLSDNTSRGALIDQSTTFHSRFRNFLRRSLRLDSTADPDLLDAEPEIGLPDNELLNNGNPAMQMSPAPAGGYKVRVEMLQVAVLIAMPSQSRTVHKNTVLDQKRDIEDDDDDDDDESPLPELVLGTTRVHSSYRPPKSGKEAALVPNLSLKPRRSSREMRDALRQSLGILPEED